MMFTHKNLMTVCCAAVLAFGLAACGAAATTIKWPWPAARRRHRHRRHRRCGAVRQRRRQADGHEADDDATVGGNVPQRRVAPRFMHRKMAMDRGRVGGDQGGGRRNSTSDRKQIGRSEAAQIGDDDAQGGVDDRRPSRAGSTTSIRRLPHDRYGSEQRTSVEVKTRTNPDAVSVVVPRQWRIAKRDGTYDSPSSVTASTKVTVP